MYISLLFDMGYDLILLKSLENANYVSIFGFFKMCGKTG